MEGITVMDNLEAQERNNDEEPGQEKGIIAMARRNAREFVHF